MTNEPYGSEGAMQRGDVIWSLKSNQRDWTYDAMLKLWKLADALGFKAVYFNDHLHGSVLETWTLLSAMLSQTSRVRGGTIVTSNSFRHPSILAKMTATVDQISGGRLTLGLGTGNEEEEYRTYGIVFPSAGERLARLEETCQILKAAWTGETFSHAGPYYTLSDATFLPRPVQQPHPWLILGVKGDRALRLAATYADEWNWNRQSADTAEFFGRMDKLDEICKGLGRDPASLRRSLGWRRLYTEVKAGRKDLAKEIESAQRCIRRGAYEISLMVDKPDDLEAEISFYRDTFIPAVLAGL